MESTSAETDFDARVAAHLRTLRAQRDLTLDELARQSGVSRSMISSIERAESSPTARVLDKLAAALGVSLATLFADEEQPGASPVSRHTEQPEWSDPETGYIRRNLSPLGFPSPITLVEVILPPGTRVAYDTGPRAAPVYHQVWILEGALTVTVGTATHRLGTGDCLAMEIEPPVIYHNPGSAPARYLAVGTTGPAHHVTIVPTGR